ncbi:helix-turn-helix domain-containing protein [Wohlfahrtiimonas chitiniclastica]|uniref:helix-turn-helix domain-containing protein n=1 Tax=Wohlfahrtiimonas chitiniclastica TaxID=400946 RepID=UPI001BCE4ECE|nr:helix-turn-helix domain-containing protein [Wohlfahrtiimonas chitiniclastica]MBS7817476.1 helix-turn-helix domain-containing protein [Wohlfahrtiimonas chitiniclastica]MBS7823230.1 helix-turn-helix domain-containing protein [Wohlfahrtiimonas chitiniclastica]MBS7831021.1 helix-turn-helix domain-containing protein [Wohlfahrtiimonas chitiniclastica]MBS7832989.1 helix-turn-helix domain-containing protein [Wohlfahrtiimonas chitiniclastica]
MTNNILSLNQPPIHPVIYPDENPIAYLIRLAHINQYVSTAWLIQHAKKSPYITYKLAHNLIIATTWITTDISPLSVAQVHISPNLLNRKYLRYCPHCLQEANYYKMTWQLQTSLVCLKHQQILLEHCPQCHKKIPLMLKQIGVCPCGYHLSKSHTKAANQYDINLQNFIDGHYTAEIFAFTREDMESLTISERMVFIIRLIGSSMENAQCAVQNKKDFKISLNVLQSIANTFFSTKEVFSEYLLKLSQIKYTNRHGAPSAFNIFYRTFYQNFTSYHFHIYKSYIESFILKNYNNSITHRNSLFNKDLVENYPWITLKHACCLIQVPPSVIRRAIKEKQLLSVIHKKGKRNFTLIYRENLQQLKMHLIDLFTFNDAQIYLGITKKQLYELLDNNTFPQAIPPRQGKNSTWHIPKKDLDELLEKLTKQSHNRIPADLTFGEATRIICGRIPQDFSQLLQAILNHEIIIGNNNKSPCAISNFRNFRIFRPLLEIWIQRKLMLHDCYTIPDLAKYLRVNQESAYQIVNFGLIDYETIGSTRLITQQHLDIFNQKYILLSHYARLHKVSSKLLIYRLSEFDIYPIDHTWDNKLRHKIYAQSAHETIEQIILGNYYICED